MRRCNAQAGRKTSHSEISSPYRWLVDIARELRNPPREDLRIVRFPRAGWGVCVRR